MMSDISAYVADSANRVNKLVVIVFFIMYILFIKRDANATPPQQSLSSFFLRKYR